MTAAGNVTKPCGLAAKIWPRTTRVWPGGEIAVGGVTLSELAARFGTPAYVLDEADVRDRCRAYARALPGAEMLAPLGIYHVRIDPMLVGSTAPGMPEGPATPRREAQRSGSPRSGRYQASRRRHGKHRCHDHSLQSRGRTLTGCAVPMRFTTVAVPRAE